MGQISVRPCTVRAYFRNVNLMQVGLIDVEGCNISIRVNSDVAESFDYGKQVCHTLTFRLVQRMLLRQ